MGQRMSAFEHYERGLVLKQVKIFHTALEEFQQAATDPQHAGKAHVQMGLCLRSTGRYKEAVVAFRQALESATFSPKERLHLLYLLGQTLESLGRYAETLEAYRWIRREDPGFLDVARRVKHLTSGGLGPVPRSRPPEQSFVEDMLSLGQQLRSRVVPLLGQAWKSIGRYAGTLKAYGWVSTKSTSIRDMKLSSKQRGSPLTTDRSLLVRKKMDKRRDIRVAIRLRSQFSSKNRMVAGEGELRDLSPGGCRVTSPVAVPVGVELECCIFPQDEAHPFTIERATVRWSRALEFGLAFTKVRPGVQRQISQLCTQRIPVG